MKNLGYYNGTFGPLEEMTIPMNDRAGSETACMRRLWPEMEKSLPWRII